MPFPSVNTDEYGSKYAMKEDLKEMFDDLKSYFASLLTPLNEEIALLKTALTSKDAEINALKSDISKVISTNEKLQSENKTLEARISIVEKFQHKTVESFQQLEAKVEDRTNRQLRQTIVIKGLPEKPNEKWADTRNILAKYIAKAYKMEFKTAYGLFERVHRGGGNGFEERKRGKRDIYALCSHWDDSELLVWKSYEVNRTKPKKDKVFIEYKYGPLTTLRRGEALKKRKEVLEQKLYRNAYVKFPAILMGRKDGEDSYSEIQNFSDICVSKLPALNVNGE